MTAESKLRLREEFSIDVLFSDAHLNDGMPFTLTYMDRWTAIRFLLPIPQVPVRAGQLLFEHRNTGISSNLYSTFNITIYPYSISLQDADRGRVAIKSYWYCRGSLKDASAACFVFLPYFRTEKGGLLYALARCIRDCISVELREAETVQQVNRDVTDLFISDRIEPVKAILLSTQPFQFLPDESQPSFSVIPQ